MPKITTRRKMGWVNLAFHWFMMLITVFLWTPIYLAARRRRVTVTHVPAGYAAPPQQPYAQPYPPQPPQQWAPPRR